VAPTTPYTKALAGREPLDTMRATTERIRALTAAWTPSQFGRSYAAGKWTAQQILTHLAQTELALGTRARMALTTPDYVAQPFDQDSWLAQERGLSGREAADAFMTLSHMNLTLYSGLSESDRQKALSHPEYGSLTVDWIIYMMAGHQAHHLAQLDLISRL
jgi:hypothetical protein